MNRLKFLFMPVCMAFFFAACNGDSSSASSDGISTSVDQEMSSSADVPASSEDVPLSSSEQSSSSVQATSSSLVDEFEWESSRSGEVKIVKRFNGDTSEVQKAGRVDIAVDDTTDFQVFLDSLNILGMGLIDSINRERKNYDVYFVKFKQDIPKTTLAEIIPGFFNSFNVDDTTKIKVSLISGFTTEETLKECHLHVECWKDVSEEDCEKVEKSCGYPDEEAYKEYGGGATFEILDCLASHKDVLSIYPGCPILD